MIKINKSFNDIPISLQVPDSNSGTNEESIITHQYRLQIIKEKNYKSISNKEGKSNVDLRFKTPDVKEKLNKLYKNCAYCEKKFTVLERPTVEHFRPKGKDQITDDGGYYWLAFSWDNLSYACDQCNKSKGSKFAIAGKKADFDLNNLSNINLLSDKYNEREKPKFVHPEFEDPETNLTFTDLGVIESDNSRYKYTITEIGLDRNELNQKRKAIFDEIDRNLQKIETDSMIDKKLKTKEEVEKFSSPENDFLAFRRFVIQHLLKERIQKLIQ